MSAQVGRRKVYVLLLAALLLLAVGPGLVVLAGCRSFIYHPTELEAEDLAELAAAPGWQSARLAMSDGVELMGLIHPARSSTATWILFFGGNGSDLEGNQWPWMRIARDPGEDLGYATFAYRGFDGSGGTPSEPALVADAAAIAEHLLRALHVAPSRLVVMGQSLGTGVATQLAASLSRFGRAPRALVLLSPYRSMRRVFDDHVPLMPVGWAVCDRFLTEEVIGDVRAPILMLHGDRDTLIPIAHARRLKELLGERARLVELAGTGHNNVWSRAEVTAAIRDALERGGSSP